MTVGFLPTPEQIEVAAGLARLAQIDLETAEKLAPDPEMDDRPVGFHAQQAVEKAVKVALTLKGIDFPKTHDLEYLIGLAGKHSIAMEPEGESASWLTPWAAEFRYDDAPIVRARLPSLRHLQAVSRRLKKTWTIARTKDYIAEPRDSGYRAMHHVVRRNGRLIEVQLRTVRQDAWANQVEDDSRRQAVGYKFGRGEEDVHDYYRVVSEAFAALDREEDLSEELVAAINEGYARVAGKLQRQRHREDS